MNYSIVDRTGNVLETSDEPETLLRRMRGDDLKEIAWAIDSEDGRRIAHMPGADPKQTHTPIKAGPKRSRPKAGDTWRWRTPTGEWRSMFVHRIQEGPGIPRAYGVRPGTSIKMQMSVSFLHNGKLEAECVSTDPDFKFETVLSHRLNGKNSGHWSRWCIQ